jgi:hypothetical protein
MLYTAIICQSRIIHSFLILDVVTNCFWYLSGAILCPYFYAVFLTLAYMTMQRELVASFFFVATLSKQDHLQREKILRLISILNGPNTFRKGASCFAD